MAVFTLTVGCASPGPPRPPSLNLPSPVTDLTAARVGDDVLLRWTNPAKTTDGLAIKGPITARICREIGSTPLHAAARSKAPCIPLLQIPVYPGASSATDTLHPPFNSDPTVLLTYSVQIDNATGHAAGPSNQAFAAAGSAPPRVEGMHASTLRTGAMIEWRQPGLISATTEAVELIRTNPALVASQKAPKTSNSPQLSAPEPAEVRLRAVQQPGSATGGTIDQTARIGETYVYLAERVRTVQLGVHSLDLRSGDSQPLTFAMRDIFPPATPAGLATIPNDAPPHLSVDLSWEPNTEPDLAGYNVYRQQLTDSGDPTGAFTRLNPAPLPGPSFRDLTAAPGQRYSYRVTAIDTAGNESQPTPTVIETAPQP